MLHGCFSNPDDIFQVSSFCGAFRPYLLALLCSMYPQDASIIEDALQGAFVKFLSLFHSRCDHGEKSLGYFVVIARHCLIDEVRKKRGRIAFDELAESELKQNVENPDDEIIAHLLISAAMMHLDQRCRFVLESYYIQERDAKTIANELGISHDSFYVVLRRCREALRALLSSKVAGVAHPKKSCPSFPQG